MPSHSPAASAHVKLHVFHVDHPPYFTYHTTSSLLVYARHVEWEAQGGDTSMAAGSSANASAS